MRRPKQDHGGGLDRAVAQFGGKNADWLDLSTGINPVPYPLPEFSPDDWEKLPDSTAMAGLLAAARATWGVPDGTGILAAPGASSLIARLPALSMAKTVSIPAPTYNEHAASFRAHGWEVVQGPAPVRVVVHPNNPTGALWQNDIPPGGPRDLLVIDESFCDISPQQSRVHLAAEKGVIILKSFGKFWGLAGVRLGFAIGQQETLAPLAARLGPWAVSGPALKIGKAALEDHHWARASRRRLKQDAERLDILLKNAGASVIGGTDLFRLAAFENAQVVRDHLAARHRILCRIFPYSKTWVRFGLPGHPPDWARLATALADLP